MIKREPVKDQPVMEDLGTLNFIARNIIYPDRPGPYSNYVSLENMMERLGGTGGEIDRLVHLRLRKK